MQNIRPFVSFYKTKKQSRIKCANVHLTKKYLFSKLFKITNN